MWPEILLYAFLITCWALAILCWFYSQWWYKVRDNYRALQPLIDSADYKAAFNAADDFRNNPPWYVKILTPSEWRN